MTWEKVFHTKCLSDKAQLATDIVWGYYCPVASYVSLTLFSNQLEKFLCLSKATSNRETNISPTDIKSLCNVERCVLCKWFLRSTKGLKCCQCRSKCTLFSLHWRGSLAVYSEVRLQALLVTQTFIWRLGQDREQSEVPLGLVSVLAISVVIRISKNPKNRQSLLNICLNFHCPIIMPVMIVCLLCPNTRGSVLNT